MSDPFQVVAAVLSCIDVGLKFYNTIAALAEEAKHAQSTATALAKKVETLNSTLKQVQGICDLQTSSGDDNVRDIGKAIRDSIESCESTLETYAAEVELLDQQSDPSRWQRIRQALKIQRADSTMSRFESGIQTHLLAIQLNISTLQIYNELKPTHEPRQILADATAHLRTHEQVAPTARQRRHTVPSLDAVPVQAPAAAALLRNDEVPGLETLRQAVGIEEDVLHNARGNQHTYAEALAAKGAEWKSPLMLTADLNGADPNSCTQDGLTLLMTAARRHDVEAVGTLLQAREIDVNLSDIDGWTAMHHAAQAGNTRIIGQLVNAGLDVNVPCTRTGETPFQLASRAINRSPTVLKALVQYKADPNKEDAYGNTALTMAVAENDHWRVYFLVSACGALYPSGKPPPRHTKKEILELIESPARRRNSR